MPSDEAKSATITDNFVAPACDDFIEILYQDDDILLINKPSGLFSLSGKNLLNWDSVHYRLVHGQAGRTPSFVNAKLPHRLDFGTSGIMVVALNNESASHLNKQFQARKVKKSYVAVLEGWLNDDEGVFSAPIAKDKELFPKVKICHIQGKHASSEYKVLQRLENPKRCLVRYNPHTGRTHQLRIHSLRLGHAILGCDLYKSAQSEAMASRLLLHASDIYFQHPKNNQQMHGQCPCSF
ncbi:MAG: RluA family pseudouridine synthase [Pseudoalteromonas sp.]|uniref:RluA family pseudouridine synthase n=1 Tax=unclassified Pseudoalteromonas TaxID=194690 RepID=UPI003F9D597A